MTEGSAGSVLQWEMLRLDGVNVSCLVGGSGPPLVYEHASSGPRVTAGIELLSSSRTIYIPVLPGFEGSDALPEGSGPRELAAWLAGLIAATFGGPVDVVGHSFGGWVVCWMAVDFADAVDRVILVSPAGFDSRVGGALEGNADTLLERSFAHPEKRRPETRSATVIAANRSTAAGYANGTTYDALLASSLQHIHARTLVVYGNKDGVIPPTSPALLADRIVGSTLTYLDDAAHNVDVDQPVHFANVITSFLTKSVEP